VLITNGPPLRSCCPVSSAISGDAPERLMTYARPVLPRFSRKGVTDLSPIFVPLLGSLRQHPQRNISLGKLLPSVSHGRSTHPFSIFPGPFWGRTAMMPFDLPLFLFIGRRPLLVVSARDLHFRGYLSLSPPPSLSVPFPLLEYAVSRGPPSCFF